MYKLFSFILNLPWTLIGIFFALISPLKKSKLNSKPFAFIFYIKSFWWYSWLPKMKYVRGMAIGNVVLLGPLEKENDLKHELIHVEQFNRKPFVHFFLYYIENIRSGYKNNKYEIEAYQKAGNVLIERK